MCMVDNSFCLDQVTDSLDIRISIDCKAAREIIDLVVSVFPACKVRLHQLGRVLGPFLD